MPSYLSLDCPPNPLSRDLGKFDLARCTFFPRTVRKMRNLHLGIFVPHKKPKAVTSLYTVCEKNSGSGPDSFVIKQYAEINANTFDECYAALRFPRGSVGALPFSNAGRKSGRDFERFPSSYAVKKCCKCRRMWHCR